MPIYDYLCRSCNAQVEVLVRGASAPTCPECRGEDLERVLSAPAVQSDTTRDVVAREARRRDAAQARDRVNDQRNYERNHDR
jgi:putative FmdB family regulatory protein